MQTAKILLSLLLIMLLSFFAFGKDKDKDHGKPNKASKKESKAKAEAPPEIKVQKNVNTSSQKLSISVQEREILHNYVNESGKKGKSLPPGLAKKVARGGELPPGWQKKMVVGETMPPEVFKVAVPLPKEIVIKLPPPPVGTITVAIEGKIVRVMEKTKQILDILELPVPRLP